MKSLALIAIAACSTFALSACGSSGSDSAASNTKPPSAASSGNGQNRGAAQRGAFGLVAAVNGSTAQVQGSNQQTAVTWKDGTVFTSMKPGSASALAAGKCVMARPARPANAPTGQAPPSAPPTGPVAAATIEVFAPVNGACALNGGQNGGQNRPSGTPSNGNRQGRGGFGASGTIASLGQGTMTVTPQARGGETPGGPITVTWTNDTKFTEAGPGKASDVKQGVCVAAQGPHDDTGTVAATSIRISQAENGACAGPGGGQGRGPGGNPPANG